MLLFLPPKLKTPRFLQIIFLKNTMQTTCTHNTQAVLAATIVLPLCYGFKAHKHNSNSAQAALKTTSTI